jgi:stage III sporulation protein AG
MEKIMEKGSGFVQWIRRGRMGQWVLAILCLAVLVVIYAVFSADGGSDVPVDESATGQSGGVSYDDIESRLEEILSQIEGAGKVRVMITYATGTETVPAMSTDSQSSVSEQSDETGSWQKSAESSEQSSPVTSRSGGEVLVLTEKMPQILGVMVVAEGAGDLSVRLALQRAVETVLQISSKKVDVFPMEKSQGGANP